MVGFSWPFHNQEAVPAKGDDFFIYRSLGKRRIILVTLFGVERTQHENIIDTIGKKFKGFDKIVYVTDLPDFLHFREAGAAFEYLPSLDQQKMHNSELSWPEYLATRWELILSKWLPKYVLAYGMNIDRFIASAPPAAFGTDHDS